MPRNYFSDPYSAGQDAFDTSYDRTQGFFDKMNRRKAGAALSSGNPTQAAAILANSGDLQGARTLQADQQAMEDRQYQRGRQEAQDKRQATEDERARVTERAAVLKQVTGAARGIPVDPQNPAEGLAKRKQFILQALPVVGQQHSMDLSPLLQQVTGLQDGQFDDQNLSAFDGELDKHIGVNLGGGGYGDYNPRTGQFKTLREPTQKAPQGFEYDADGNLQVDPGFVKGKAAIAAATRAPRRPTGGGGAAAAHGPVLNVDPNTVKWNP